ncbi:MAG TPA: hypothetical protein EYP43_01800, partial [Thermoplasmata archaeon]|nr:hypothetical protein [Thermoplasmata archaeon]
MSVVHRMLARTLAPLLFWMSAGWATFPYTYARLMDMIGEDLDLGYLPWVSYGVAATFLVAGIEAAIYGRETPDHPGTVPLAMDRLRCP